MDYTLIRRTKTKRIWIRIEADGRVVVTAPPRVSEGFIVRFVADNEDWISRQQSRLRLIQITNPLLDRENRIVSYFGKHYYYCLVENTVQRVTLTNNQILVSPVTGIEEDMEKTLTVFLRKQSQLYITQSLMRWSNEMNLRYKKVSYRQQTSRWGSCSSRGNLNFNWRLVHFKRGVIDYVVIHELAHLKHQNHSPAFWELVAKYDRRYKDHRQVLKRQSIWRI